MSLQAYLTVPRLRAIAGYAFARGEAYWKDGRVLSCELEDDTLDGTVIGGTRYQVRMSAHGGRLVADCTCPVDAEICKHAVALGLHFLARPDALAPPPPAASSSAFAQRAALEQWAEQHHVSHALALSAEVLIPRLPSAAGYHHPSLKYVLGRLSLRNVGSADSAALHTDRRLAPLLVEVTRAALEDAAASVRTALDEELVVREAPADPALAALWSKLQPLRRTIRAHAFPRARSARSSSTWAFDAETCAVIWKEADRIVRTSPDFGTFAVVTRLTMPGGGQPRLECSCKVRDAACTHGLALIDATLDVLVDPARAAEARILGEELLRPGWSRALEELARFEAKPAKPRPVIEVWWRVEHELGSLTLSPVVKKQTRRGTMSAGSRISVARLLDDYRDQLADQDLRIAEHFLGWQPAGRTAGTYPSRAFLALAGHPRVLTDDTDAPIAVVRVPLGFTALAAGDQIRLEPSIEGERFSPRLLGPLLGAFAAGEPLFTIDPDRPRLLLIDVGDEARRLWDVLEKHGDSFPPESHGPLLDRLARLEAKLPLVVPHALKGTQLDSELRVVVRVRLLPDVTLELELFVRPGPGAPLFAPGSGPRDVMLVRDGERGYVRRQLATEHERARGLLARLPIEGAEEGPPGCFQFHDPDAALQLVAALQSPPPGLDAEWVTARPVIASAPSPKALALQVDHKRDWFGITGELKIEAGRLELAVLLDAARRQQRYVRLDEHRWVELSDVLRQRLLAVADQTFSARNRLELSPGAAPAIRALAEAGATVESAPAWQLLTERLAASARLSPKPPTALTATLRDYQVEGHAWLSRVAAWGAGACLADDMGLGKTVQAIAVLLDRARLGPALVLAPTSVSFNWVEELARFAPTLRPVLYGEQPDRAGCLAKLRKKDVLIVSYGLLVRDGAALAATPFATLVIDEAQALKNAATRRARAARSLDAGFRIALSGTPLENHLGELWSLFAIVFPGLLGSWEQFRERFAGPIERTKDPEARAALSRVIRPFLLRRTKQEVARELPSRTEIQVPIALSKDEWALYEDARLAAVAELADQGKGIRNEQQRFRVLAALTRLRLLASHPKLYDARSQVSSSKMRRLLELLAELRDEGHRALVFSQFTSHLALVRDELDRAGFHSLYLDGATPAARRATLVRSFQAGEADVFLISLKAGGTGINLTAADYVIHLDPWWNPAVEDQATDRAHRIGQTRPVTVYRLITRGTIEEKILALHGEKRALVAGILDGTDVAARLTTRDLLDLLATSRTPPVASDDEDRDRATAAR